MPEKQAHLPPGQTQLIHLPKSQAGSTFRAELAAKIMLELISNTWGNGKSFETIAAQAVTAADCLISELDKSLTDETEGD